MCIKQVVVESCVTVKAVWAWGLFPLAYILAKQAELSSYPVKPCSCITPRELDRNCLDGESILSIRYVENHGSARYRREVRLKSPRDARFRACGFAAGFGGSFVILRRAPRPDHGHDIAPSSGRPCASSCPRIINSTCSRTLKA